MMTADQFLSPKCRSIDINYKAALPCHPRRKIEDWKKKRRRKRWKGTGTNYSPVLLLSELLQKLSITSSRTPLAAPAMSVSVTTKYHRECLCVDKAARPSIAIIRQIIQTVRRLQPYDTSDKRLRGSSGWWYIGLAAWKFLIKRQDVYWNAIIKDWSDS